MIKKICILDYGSGNVKSVQYAFERLGYESSISNLPEVISNSSHLVLPGVGSYGAAMEKIQKKLPLEKIDLEIKAGKPILGICVGMQVFSSIGFEFGEWKGLNYFENSEVREINTSLPKPHIGWNNVELNQNHELMREIPDYADFYFVHSFIFSGVGEVNTIATSTYGEDFASVIANDNIMGTQFHPEKSQKYGLQLLSNFAGFRS
jgi:imidazole glycerol-phosphate synthase subunit HisH